MSEKPAAEKDRVIDYAPESLREILIKRVPPEMDFPKVVLIDTISFCNLRCSMCPHVDMTRKKGKMSWELYRKIIDEIAENEPDAQIWITFFGEGALLLDLPEKVAYAREKGLSNIILNSNGNMLNSEFSERLIKAGLNGLYVGIDAFDPETYPKYRVGGNLAKVTAEVLEYQRLLGLYGKEDQTLVVQFVEMDENIAEQEDFINFWSKQHGIKCKIRPRVSWGGLIDAPNLQSDMERIPCYWAMNTINITDIGMVVMCSCDLDSAVPMGDINHQTIKEVWNTTLKDFRMRHRQEEWQKLPKNCRNCKDWQSGFAKYTEV